MGFGNRIFMPQEITINSMYVMLRDESSGLLRCEYEPMGVKVSEIQYLQGLAKKVRDEERRLVSTLVAELERIYERRFYGSISGPNPDLLLSKLNSALDCVYSDTILLEPIAKKADRLLVSAKRSLVQAGGKHQSIICRLYAMPFASWGFEVPPAEFLSLALKPEDVDQAKRAAGRLPKARKAIDVAKGEYCRIFEGYIAAIEIRVPGITTPKEYCPRLSDAYVELDYRPEPANAQIVDEVIDYYRAQRLEESIAALSKRADVVGYSTRYCGYLDRANHRLRDVVIPLDPSTQMMLTIRTNFGYGRSSFFYSTLSFMGVNVLNADLVIFYHGIEESEYVRATDVYAIEEKSFQQCFDAAVACQHELREIGVEAFIDRYVKGSIEKLANLMFIIARSNTFLDITSLSLFSDLMSRGSSLVMPGLGFSKRNYALDDSTQALVTRFADSVKVSGDELGRVDCSWDVETLGELKELLSVDYSYGRDLLAQLAQLDLARQMLVSKLRDRYGGQGWIMQATEDALPMPEECQLLELSGYELFAFRARKASIVLTLLDNIRKATKAIACANLVESLIDSCRLIAVQCSEYLRDVLNPEIARLKQEGLRVAREVKALEALGDEAYIEHKGELDDLKQRLESLREELRGLNKKGSVLAEFVERVGQV